MRLMTLIADSSAGLLVQCACQTLKVSFMLVCGGFFSFVLFSSPVWTIQQHAGHIGDTELEKARNVPTPYIFK